MFPLEKMCTVLKVSPSGYYNWQKMKIGPRAESRKLILQQIKKVYKENKGRYGSPRITRVLREEGMKVSRPRVARIMRGENIRCITSKKFRVGATDSNHDYEIADNHLERQFSAEESGTKWASDITYISTGEGWLYLTMVMDLYDRKIIGWALSDNLKASSTTVRAFQMAALNRKMKGKLLFHSDRGVQYACNEFRRLLAEHSVLQSMSRKGNCYDNSVCESFFKTLKTELVYHEKYASRKQAELSLFEYIEVYYNRKRKHSALNYRSPEEYGKIKFEIKQAA